MWRIPDPISWIPPGNAGQALMRFIIASLNLKDAQKTSHIFREIMGPYNNLGWHFKCLMLFAKFFPHVFAVLFRTSTSLFFAQRFIAANDDIGIARAVLQTSRRGLKTNFDILGEAVTSEKQTERYVQAYFLLIIRLMHWLPSREISISLKPSAFYSQISSVAPEHSAEVVAKRLDPIIALLKKIGGHAYLDAEESESLEVQKRVFEILYKKYGSAIRFVLQAYLKSSFNTLKWLISINNPDDPIHFRLVRGAYWDHECMRAERLSWNDAPVYTDKDETDLMYHTLIWQGMRHGLVVNLGTHNIISIVNAINSYISMRAWGYQCGIPEFQMLHGMPGVKKFSKILCQKGYSVRIYSPALYPKGEAREGIAYLVRRILENQSQMSFLVQHSGAKMKEAIEILQKIPSHQDLPDIIKQTRVPKEAA